VLLKLRETGRGATATYSVFFWAVNARSGRPAVERVSHTALDNRKYVTELRPRLTVDTSRRSVVLAADDMAAGLGRAMDYVSRGCLVRDQMMFLKRLGLDPHRELRFGDQLRPRRSCGHGWHQQRKSSTARGNAAEDAASPPPATRVPLSSLPLGNPPAAHYQAEKGRRRKKIGIAGPYQRER
jgi:hypothetical protein